MLHQAEASKDKYSSFSLVRALSRFFSFSRQVFMRSLVPKTPAKPVYDPLSAEKQLWRKMGVKANGVFGVPNEYEGWQATATADPSSLKHLPDYVKRAEEELGGGAVANAANGWHSHPIVPSRWRARAVAVADDNYSQPASVSPPPSSSPSSPYARTVGSYVAPPAAAPAAEAVAVREGLDGNVNAQTLQSIVKAAVAKALKARKAQEKQDDAHKQHVLAEDAPTATPVAGQTKIVWATAVPVTSTRPKSIRMSASSEVGVASAPTPASDFAASDADKASAGGASESDAVALVKQMAQTFESTRQAVRTAEQQQQRLAAGSDGNGGDAASLRRQRSALLDEEAIAKPRDRLLEDTEAVQISKLKNEVKKMKEQQRVQRLKRQVDRLKSNLRSRGYHYHNKASTHSLASANSDEGDEFSADADASDEAGHDSGVEGDVGGDAEEGADVKSKEEDAEVKGTEETGKLPEYRTMRVCDGLGCSTQVVPQAGPPHVVTEESIKQELEGKSLMDTLFPDPNTWESEVHLNAKGQIRADHDDPHG